MNKPTPLKESAPVRRRPFVSIEKRRREENKAPPYPPSRVALDFDPIPIEVRRVRAVNGSRRQRDLAAVRMAEELERLERMQGTSPAARSAFANLIARCWHAVPDSTFAIWLSPLQLAGTAGDALLLTAPDGIRTWLERRYTPLIREALQATGSDYTDVEFVSMGEAL